MEVAVRRLAALAALALPGLAQAHSFGRSYNLPVPLWLYAWGAAAALLLSFLLIGWFFRATPSPAGTGRPLPEAWQRLAHTVRRPLQGLALALLLLAIVSGLCGTGDPYRNFNMTWFWIVFVLGLSYVTALIGDLYAVTNPWRTLTLVVGKVLPGFARGRFAYPPWLAYWPALALYFGFIWVELFGRTMPQTLSLLLIAYTGINLLGSWLFGVRHWFQYGEFFAVFLRLLGLMAPLYRADDGRLHWRLPFSGLAQASAGHFSLLLFVLFMLSSTAFDGLHATEPWYRLFWSEPLAWLRALAGNHPTEAYLRLRAIHLGFESFILLLSPLFYLAAYLACLALAKALLGSTLTLRELALRFAFSLLPIAFVYHLTHYFTLLLTQGPMALNLLSDPLGRGWNLFGTAGLVRRQWLPDIAWVWHAQVGLILLGHVLSVGLAHHEALRLFPRARDALLSQLPMLVLMMGFTVAGLWILALPLQSGG